MRYSSYYLYRKYEKRDGQDVLPVIPTTYSIDGEGTLPKVLNLEDDPNCEEIPLQHRWITADINTDFICEPCSGSSINCKVKGETGFGDKYYVECDGDATLNLSNLNHIIDAYSVKSVNIGDCVNDLDGSLFTYNAFPPESHNNDKCEMVFIPSTITNIKENTFNRKIGVRYVKDAFATCVVPKSLRKISQSGFTECRALHNIELFDNINEIGESAFKKCLALTSIHISSSMTEISESCFEDCKGLCVVEIPSNINKINKKAFYGSGVEMLKGFNGVNTMGEYAFSNCKKLTEILFEDGLKIIGDYAFSGCTKLLKATITNNSNLASIGAHAFDGCSLTSINIPSGVTSIGEHAFDGCSLTSINIPSGVTSIGEHAFRFNGKTLSSIYVDEKNRHFESMYGLLIEKSINCVLQASNNSRVIPNTIVNIGSYSFYGCSGIIGNLTIPKSVAYIGPRAFWECSGLTSFTFLSPTPPRIGDYMSGNNPINLENCLIYVPQAYYDTYLRGVGGWIEVRGKIRPIE